MSEAPKQTLLAHMEYLAEELKCVVIYRLGMFHFIPSRLNPSKQDLELSVKSASQAIPKPTLIEIVARAIHSKRQQLGFGGQAIWDYEPEAIRSLHCQTAQSAIEACHMEEMHGILRRLTAPYAGPDSEPLEDIVRDADSLLTKLGAKS